MNAKRHGQRGEASQGRKTTPFNRPSDRLSEEDYRRRSLGKQSHLNLFTAWGAIAATAAFIVIFVTLKETMIQVSLNRQQFVAGTRASVGVEELHIEGKIYTLPALAMLVWSPTFRLKNFGKSTAIDVNVWASLTTDVVQKRFREIARSDCEVAFEFKKSSQRLEIFPDQEVPFGFRNWVDPMNVPPPRSPPGPFRTRVMVGCVVYADRFKRCQTLDDCHWTQFSYWVRTNADGDKILSVEVYPDGPNTGDTEEKQE
jgi:hypothetical protein